MKKKLLVSILLCLFIFFLGVLAKESDAEQKQTDVDKTKIVEEWQTDPDAFARLFFGDDLSWELAKKRKPGGAFCSDEVTKAIFKIHCRLKYSIDSEIKKSRSNNI